MNMLLGRKKQVVVTNYRIKTEEPIFVAVNMVGERIKTTESSTGLQPIAFSGFGVSLIETSALKNVPQPWFCPTFDINQTGANSGGYTIEDQAFFDRLRHAGVDVWLDHDASKMVGHIGRRTWRWDS